MKKKPITSVEIEKAQNGWIVRVYSGGYRSKEWIYSDRCDAQQVVWDAFNWGWKAK